MVISRESLESKGMTLHLYGATLSPGCANFTLKPTANDFEKESGAATARFL